MGCQEHKGGKAMNKKQKSTIAVFAILSIVYNILFFTIPFPKNKTVWCGYVFTWVALAASLYAVKMAFDSGKELESKVYGYPIFRIGVIYMIAQMVVGLFFDLLGFVLAVPMWILMVISVLMLGAALIGMIATDNARDVIEQTVEKNRAQIKPMKIFKLDIACLADMTEDSSLKTGLKKLEEDFRYSDPVSNENLHEIEGQIQGEIGILKGMLVAKGDEQTILEQIQKVKNLVLERNRMCKMGKGY